MYIIVYIMDICLSYFSEYYDDIHFLENFYGLQ